MTTRREFVKSAGVAMAGTDVFKSVQSIPLAL